MQFDLNFGDEFYANELFDIESYKFNGGMSSKEIEELLSSYEIIYGKYVQGVNPNLINYKTSGNVVLSVVRVLFTSIEKRSIQFYLLAIPCGTWPEVSWCLLADFMCMS